MLKVKRIVSSLLAGIMLVLCFQTGAFADDTASSTVHQVAGDTVIDATGYQAISTPKNSDDDAAYINAENYWVLSNDCLRFHGDYGTDLSADYKINVAEGAADNYKIGVRMSSWRSGSDGPTLTISVDGASVGSPAVPYYGDVKESNAYLAVSDFGIANLTEGEHTITVSTNWGCDTYIQSIVLERHDYTDINGSTEIKAKDYNTLSNAETLYVDNCWLVSEECLFFKKDDYGNTYSADYNIKVAEDTSGKYLLGLRMSIWRNGTDNPYFKISVDGTEIGSAMAPYDGNAAKANKLLDLCEVGYANLSPGKHTITVSTNWSCDAWLQSIVFTEQPNIINGDVEISAANYSSYTADDGASIKVAGYDKVNYKTCVQLNGYYGKNISLNYKIRISEGFDGKFNIGLRLGCWTDVTSSQPTISLSVNGGSVGSVKSPYVGDTARTDSLLELLNIGQASLKEGVNDVTVSTNWGNTSWLQSIVFEKVNIINEINGDTVIDPVNYSTANSCVTKGTYSDIGGAELIKLTDDASKNAYLVYVINVTDDAAGRYRLKLRACNWRQENASSVLRVQVDGETDSSGNVLYKAGGRVPYEGNIDKTNNLLPICDMGNINLTAGRHTVKITGRGYDTRIQQVIFDKIDGSEFSVDVTSDNTEIPAINYYTATDKVINNICWNNGDKLSLFLPSTYSETRNKIDYKINVSEDAAGEFNIGVKAVGWNVKEPYIKVYVDGNMLGFIQAEDDVGSRQQNLSPLYVRTVSLAAGEHTITLVNDWGCNTFIESIVLDRPGTNDIKPAEVEYTRTASKKGFAEGTVTVTPPEEGYENVKAYHLYWGDENGKLEGYTAFGYILADGANSVTFNVNGAMMYPSGTTRILAYCAKKTTEDYSDVSDYFENEAYLELNAYAETAIDTSAVLTLNEDDKLFSFQILSDQHVTDSLILYSEETQRAFEDIVKTDPDTLVVFSGGDNVDNGTKEEQYKMLESIYNDTLGKNNIPYYITPGNHEQTGIAPTGDSTTTVARELYKTYANKFSGDENFITDSNRLYWSKKVGNSYLVSLASENQGAYYYPSETQLQWLEDILDKAEAEGATAFVFCHQPIKNTVAGSFTNRRKDSGADADEIDPAIEARFKELFNSHHNALLFSGHSHTKADSLDNVYRFEKDGVVRYFNVPNVGAGRIGSPLRQECILEGDDASVTVPFDNRSWKSYVNQYTTMPEGYYVDVYSDYVVIKGRSFDTYEWLGGSQNLVVVDYSPFTALKTADNELTLTANSNYADDFEAYAAVYNADNTLVKAVKLTKAELLEGKKTIPLPEVSDRSVKVFAFDNALAPLTAAIVIE